jgi:hypothetical protein
VKKVVNTRIPEWSLMINWANIQNAIENELGLIPDQASIEAAIYMLQNDMPEEQIYQLEAEELEEQLVSRLLKILRKSRAKDIKRVRKDQKEKQDEGNDKQPNMDVQIFGPLGNMGNLKDMGLDIDPKVLKSFTDSLLGSMFKKQKKKDKDDEDEEEDDPGSSFYM